CRASRIARWDPEPGSRVRLRPRDRRPSLGPALPETHFVGSRVPGAAGRYASRRRGNTVAAKSQAPSGRGTSAKLTVRRRAPRAAPVALPVPAHDGRWRRLRPRLAVRAVGRVVLALVVRGRLRPHRADQLEGFRQLGDADPGRWEGPAVRPVLLLVPPRA